MKIPLKKNGSEKADDHANSYCQPEPIALTTPKPSCLDTKRLIEYLQVTSILLSIVYSGAKIVSLVISWF
ncbi:hypothetical protein BST98_21520 (plasmid) [Photobacterium damselae]|nr:hypothetical protein BST98_21520 [Photobacterium damselae]